MHIRKALLPNGLRVIYSQDDTTQMVAVNVLYDVGSKDESEHKTGFAHLFEHLMFGGSLNIPDYDRVVQNGSGENNAWTNTDLTNYYVILPKENLPIGLWLEADRMNSLSFHQRSLDIQKQVVMEEFKERCLNQPYGDTGHLLRDLCYKTHPYRWPTIGLDLSHIEKATLEDVKEFFFAHYGPNNAILSVVGNVEWDQVLELSDRYFGSIPSRVIHPRNWLPEPIQTAPRMMEVSRDVPLDTLYKSFAMCHRRGEDYYVCDLLSDLLSNGRSSRLYNQLVLEKKIFTQIDCYISGDIEPGRFMINGKPHPGISLQEADKRLTEELSVLQTEWVSDYELSKVGNKFESSHYFSNFNYANAAFNIAYYELLGDVTLIDTEVDRYRAVSKDDIQRVARYLFDINNSSTLYYKSRSSDWNYI